MRYFIALLLLFLSTNILAQNSLTLGWYDAPTEEQKKSNPTYVAYPLKIKDQIPVINCNEDPVWYFSVSASKKVKFSSGNLQYQASTKTWRFAENQWDYVGNSSEGTVYENGTKCNNDNISAYYSGWIDLFGWCTSGYNNMYPYLVNNNPTKYGPHSTTVLNQYDWGYYNMYPWRTLKYSEGDYLIYGRNNASQLYCQAIVHGVKGLMLLPDNWTNSSNLTLTMGGSTYSANTISDDDWTILESDGAVFLPAASYRYVVPNTGAHYTYNNEKGYYWSFSYQNTLRAWAFTFGESSAVAQYFYRSQGFSVRLVQDL